MENNKVTSLIIISLNSDINFSPENTGKNYFKIKK